MEWAHGTCHARRPIACHEAGGRAAWIARIFGPSTSYSHAVAAFANHRRRRIDFAGTPPHKTGKSRPAGGRSGLSFEINMVRRPWGRVSRAAKGADCKSAGYAFVGSSPTSPTSTF